MCYQLHHRAVARVSLWGGVLGGRAGGCAFLLGRAALVPHAGTTNLSRSAAPGVHSHRSKDDGRGRTGNTRSGAEPCRPRGQEMTAKEARPLTAPPPILLPSRERHRRPSRSAHKLTAPSICPPPPQVKAVGPPGSGSRPPAEISRLPAEHQIPDLPGRSTRAPAGLVPLGDSPVPQVQNNASPSRAPREGGGGRGEGGVSLLAKPDQDSRARVLHDGQHGWPNLYALEEIRVISSNRLGCWLQEQGG